MKNDNSRLLESAKKLSEGDPMIAYLKNSLLGMFYAGGFFQIAALLGPIVAPISGVTLALGSVFYLRKNKMSFSDLTELFFAKVPRSLQGDDRLEDLANQLNINFFKKFNGQDVSASAGFMFEPSKEYLLKNFNLRDPKSFATQILQKAFYELKIKKEDADVVFSNFLVGLDIHKVLGLKLPRPLTQEEITQKALQHIQQDLTDEKINLEDLNLVRFIQNSIEVFLMENNLLLEPGTVLKEFLKKLTIEGKAIPLDIRQKVEDKYAPIQNIESLDDPNVRNDISNMVSNEVPMYNSLSDQEKQDIVRIKVEDIIQTRLGFEDISPNIVGQITNDVCEKLSQPRDLAQAVDAERVGTSTTGQNPEINTQAQDKQIK